MPCQKLLTEINSIPYTFEWTIKNVDLIDQVLHSSTFSTNSDDGLTAEWRMGLNRAANGFLYLQIKLLSKSREFRFTSATTLLVGSGETLRTSQTKCQSTKQFSAIFDYINAEEIVIASKMLQIVCQVHIIQDKAVCRSEGLALLKATQFTGSNDQLAIDFHQMLENQHLTDVTFCFDGCQLRAHKLILTARSPVFAAMFRSDMEEKQTNCVDIRDISFHVFRQLLNYIYTGKVVDIKNIAGELLAAADKYDLQSLKMMCLESLFENLTLENTVEIFTLANLYSFCEVKKYVLDFIIGNVGGILTANDWELLIDKSPEIAHKILITKVRKLDDA